MCRTKRMEDAILQITQLGLKAAAISEKGTEDLTSLDHTTPTCLVLGDEHRGVSAEVMNTVAPASPFQCKAKHLRSTSVLPQESCFTLFSLKSRGTH